MKMPKVSVIVPVYNVEQYLERCIESLINQTLEDIEIILVDDGSTDGCPAFCDRYAEIDNRIKVIHKKNDGVSAARNDGFAIATGEWVIFCDSDDWMEPDGLDSLYNIGIQENVDVAVGDINLIRGHETIYNQFFANEFSYRDREDMDMLVMADIHQGYCPNPPKTPTIGYGGPWNKLVRRQFLAEKGITFDVSLLGIFDDILYTAYVYANMDSITYIQKPVYNYVVVTTSITKSYKANTLDINKRIFTAFNSFIETYAPDGKWDRAFDAMVVRRFEEALKLYFFSKKNPKKHSKIMEEMRQTIKTEPYLSAVSKVELDRLLSHQRRVARLMKSNFVFGIWMLYKLKLVLRRV